MKYWGFGKNSVGQKKKKFVRFFDSRSNSRFPPFFWDHSLLSIPIFGMLLENLYGAAAYAKYCLIVTVVTGVVCAVVGAAVPFITGSLTPWFDLDMGGYFGFQPILMASFVALKQVMPESIIALAFVVRVKLKQLPFVTLSLTLCAAIVLPSRGALPFAVSLLVSWCYLRFFSSLQTPSTTGDLRDSFSFASFFPAIAQPWIMPISRRIDGFRFWPNSTPKPGAAGAILPVVTVSSTSIPMTQAARDHRAVAQQLVTERIAELDRSQSIAEVVVSFDDSATEKLSVTSDAAKPK